MQVDYDVILDILLYSTGFFLLYYLCYRHYIYSLLDPLFIYVFTLSFSSVLVIYTLADRPAYLFHFFLCHIFLFIGFTLTVKWLKCFDGRVQPILFPDQFFDYKILRLVLYFLFTFYFLANVLLFYTTGFALLSDDPTISKVENFAKGFGVIQKINFSVGSFLTSGFIFFVLSKPNRFDFIFLFFVILLTGLEGSKSSLLRILITLVLLTNHSFFKQRSKVISKLKLVLPIGMLFLLGVFFTVLLKENTDPEQAMFSFVRRLLYGSDSILYFYAPVNEQYFAQYHFWDYPSHFFNQILGFLRLVSLREAFGNVMVANVFPNMIGTIVGPNTSYYIEGQIFFGYYGAFIYSALIGSCYAFIRQYFFNTQYYSAFWLVLICCICQQASALNIEVTLFVTQVFDTLFFVLPVYITISFVIHGKLRLRKLHF